MYPRKPIILSSHQAQDHAKELPWIRTECVIDTVQASSSRALQISKTKGLVCIGSCAFQDRGNSKLGAFGGLGQPSAGHKGLRTFGMYRPLELETFGLGVSAVLVQAAAYLAQAVVFLYKVGDSVFSKHRGLEWGQCSREGWIYVPLGC